MKMERTSRGTYELIDCGQYEGDEATSWAVHLTGPDGKAVGDVGYARSWPDDYWEAGHSDWDGPASNSHRAFLVYGDAATILGEFVIAYEELMG
jgi:hypothetical protein